jgi:hypothetical protein
LSGLEILNAMGCVGDCSAAGGAELLREGLWINLCHYLPSRLPKVLSITVVSAAM